MGTAGLIFGAIAVAWIAYLVPWFLGHRDQSPARTTDPADEIAARMRIVRSGDEPLAPQLPAEVSTVLTRRAELRELRNLSRRAARRRALVVALLLTIWTVFAVTEWLGWTSSWPTVLFGVLLAGYLVVARVSVQAMNAQLEARLREVKLGDDEATIAVLIAPNAVDRPESRTIAVAAPAVPLAGSLWDPIPVTAPTYVSTPLAPRTVRTIDLSAPMPAASGLPVTADPQVLPGRREEGGTWRRAAGN